MVLSKSKRKANIKPIPVYIASCFQHFFLSLVAMSSLYFFYSDIEFYILDDGTLTIWQKIILKKICLPIIIIAQQDLKRIEQELVQFPNLLSFYKYGWSGKRFILPFLCKKGKKFILLDSDTFFLQSPKDIINWANYHKTYNLYLQDYQNFSIVSPVEVKSIFKRTPQLSKVNSRLLCFNGSIFSKRKSLIRINNWIKDILLIVKSRMTYDFNTKNDIV